MARKLDAERIEQARHQSQRTDRREQEKQHIRETIERNRKGERKVTVIMPERKEYAYQEAAKVRVAAYCLVSAPLKRHRLAALKCRCSISRPR